MSNPIASEKLIDSVKRVIDTPAGKEFIWALLFRCGVGSHIAITENMVEALTERNLGLEVLSWCTEADPYFYANIFKQKKREELADKG